MISALIAQFCGEKTAVKQPSANHYGFTSKQVWPRKGYYAKNWPVGLPLPRIYAEREVIADENTEIYFARIEGQDMFWTAPIFDAEWWQTTAGTPEACERTHEDGTVWRINFANGIVEQVLEVAA